jgi:hypothetical protein
VAVLGIPAGCGWLAVWQIQGQEIDLLAAMQAWLAGALMVSVAAPLALPLTGTRAARGRRSAWPQPVPIPITSADRRRRR